MAKNFKKTAIKTEKMKKSLKKVIPLSLRGAKRRSNPKKENLVHWIASLRSQ